MELRISSTDKAQRLPDGWEKTNVTWGSEATEIKIPGHIQTLPLTKKEKQKSAEPRNTDIAMKKTHHWNSLLLLKPRYSQIQQAWNQRRNKPA